MKKIISLNSTFINLINNNLTYAEFQQKLEEIYQKTQNLPLILDILHKEQLHKGVISQEGLDCVKNFSYPIKDPVTDMEIIFQSNPARQKRGISNRVNPNPVNILPGKNIPCFCCMENIKNQWPDERGFEIKVDHKEYVFLPNPSPLFDKHLVLVSKEHRPMNMNINLGIKISDKLPNHWITQNDIDAGASNPWHFHLQLCEGDYYPIVKVPAEKSIKKQIDGQDLIIEKLKYPFEIYRFKFSKVSEGVISFLTKLTNEYLKIHSDNRFTYAIKNKGDEFELYVVLRDAKKQRVSVYGEAIGFPEPMGFVASPLEKDKEPWLKDGIGKYRELLQGARIDSAIARQFEKMVFPL